MPTLHAALAGNPNVGKSSIFNALTGAQQHTGNWPGKTVERATGRFQAGDLDVDLVDLPGAYSLSAYSPEEIITRDYLVRERPSLVINVVDAANLERNLYLTLQIIETGTPLLLALTMTDLARQRGLRIDYGALSAALGGVSVVSCVGHTGIGMADLRAAVRLHAKGAPECPHCR
ncbi:50S ribosome-binding GTPase [Oscillochloris sp. ZM17-4]|uniref:FeoB small GTPase domain-containing protein n=1 Tax=Oscillochloris sp. ZM17-4 TaxID=2866714 RepID=UPI001C7365B1|nr:FeoB small GTPase domain-containing protein [Oscillochloris sp. ZM17-4]MBX0328466.1 50S ribosome-binding GTPase [Oscillochloris sp. ZM17-4]